MNLPLVSLDVGSAAARGHLAAVELQRADAALPYLLAMVSAVSIVLFIAWYLRRYDVQKLESSLHAAKEQAQRLEHERDLAQDELFRRLYEERELNKEKTQFQAQLAEYEKYSALARLALGAAHEINNPLLGILSHLELELKAASDHEVRTEIEQCIAGAKRISSTLRGLVNYARPGPLVLSRVSLHRLVADTLGFLEASPCFVAKRWTTTFLPGCRIFGWMPTSFHKS